MSGHRNPEHWLQIALQLVLMYMVNIVTSHRCLVSKSHVGDGGGGMSLGEGIVVMRMGKTGYKI